MKHANIPIFIPHLGCPNQCVFCNQRSISGKIDFKKENVRGEIENALKTIDEDTETEIAFFGGSFTGIDRELMIYLLSVAKEYIDSGRVKSVRLSTRPDYIDEEILEILKKYGVEHIELGLQSMRDSVLTACGRGHNSEIARKSAKMILDYGFSLVGQMMIGLPSSSVEDEIYTAKEIVKMGAKGARIYPTVVFRDTELAKMQSDGRYTPLTLEDAILRSKEALKVFVKNGVECIRIGLCASENLTNGDKVTGGANHPALGEYIMSSLYFDNICEKIDRTNIGRSIIVEVNKGGISKAVGQKRENYLKLKEKYGFSNIKFRENEELKEYEIKIYKVKEDKNVLKES